MKGKKEYGFLTQAFIFAVMMFISNRRGSAHPDSSICHRFGAVVCIAVYESAEA